ncbi:MAG: hypothetical protein ACRDVW_01585 [Acidimicrobiales bacterium]
MRARPSIVTLCTGNAARSVMAEFMLRRRAQDLGLEVVIVSAGTHVVEGQPMGMRTRAALASIPELDDFEVSRHRSKQLGSEQLAGADVVVAMESDHVRFVRRHHPEAARSCATLRRLCVALPPGDNQLGERVRALGLERLPLDPAEDVADPAGGDLEVYLACAQELWGLAGELARCL